MLDFGSVLCLTMTGEVRRCVSAEIVCGRSVGGYLFRKSFCNETYICFWGRRTFENMHTMMGDILEVPEHRSSSSYTLRFI